MDWVESERIEIVEKVIFPGLLKKGHPAESRTEILPRERMYAFPHADEMKNENYPAKMPDGWAIFSSQLNCHSKTRSTDEDLY